MLASSATRPSPGGDAARVGRYCLFCYAPMERSRKASQVCEACGHINLEADHELYWTRERGLVWLESSLKAAVTVVVVWVFYLILFSRQTGMAHGHGWGAGFPVVFGWLGWQTAGAVTARRGLLRFGLVWGIILAIVGALTLTFATATTIAWFEHPARMPVESLLLTDALALVAPVLAVVSFRSRTWYRNWRERHVARRTARHVAPA